VSSIRCHLPCTVTLAYATIHWHNDEIITSCISWHRLQASPVPFAYPTKWNVTVLYPITARFKTTGMSTYRLLDVNPLPIWLFKKLYLLIFITVCLFFSCVEELSETSPVMMVELHQTTPAISTVNSHCDPSHPCSSYTKRMTVTPSGGAGITYLLLSKIRKM
jgi:hypothetical protein